MRTGKRCFVYGVILVLLLVAAPASLGSVILARDASSVQLAINAKGQALITYKTAGVMHRVIAWGAIDAQTRMRLDYSGGWAIAKKPLWKSFRDVSGQYDGPPLHGLIVARRAPDGSYWALQAWQRKLPNYGLTPSTRIQRAMELHLSHWRGEIPLLEVWTDWVFHGQHKHLFGRYTYRGQPVFGFSNTPAGVPTDAYGRNVYLDTYNSAYGAGWKRENSFLTHRPGGTFCYGFYTHGYLSGEGERYRILAIGPGVAPDPYWESPDPGPYDPARDAEMNALQQRHIGDDPRCQKP